MEKKSLAEWMIDKGLGIRGLARAANVSTGLVSQVLSGKNGTLRNESMKSIALALGVEVRQVIEFDEVAQAKLTKLVKTEGVTVTVAA